MFAWLVALAASCGVSAQQPSRELQELRDTANAFYRAGDYAQSLRFAEQALPLFIREFGPEHEQTGIHYYSLGLIAEAAGNLALAQRYYADTVRVREKIYGVDGPSVAEGLEKLGAVYIKMGRPDAAEPIFRRALKLKQDLIGFRHAYAASGHSNLGDVALARGDWPAALTSYREAISLLTGQDTSQTLVKSIVDDEIRRYRDTFVGLCRAAWETRQQPARRSPAGRDVSRRAAGLEHLGRLRARQDDGPARRRRHRPRPAHPRRAGPVRAHPAPQRRRPEAAHRLVQGADGRSRPTARRSRSSRPPAPRAPQATPPSSASASWPSSSRR